MKWIYVLIVLIISASALGCVDNKQTDTRTEAPASSPETSAPEVTPAPTGDDLFGTESELAAVDSLVSDSNMDVTLSNTI